MFVYMQSLSQIRAHGPCMTHGIDRKRNWWHDPKLFNAGKAGNSEQSRQAATGKEMRNCFWTQRYVRVCLDWIDRKGIGDRIENYSTGKACKQTSDWQRNTELSLNVVLPQYHVPRCHNTTVPQYHIATVSQIVTHNTTVPKCHVRNCCRARWCDASNRTTELIERNDGSCMAKLWCDCSAGKKDWQCGQRLLDQDQGSQIKD